MFPPKSCPACNCWNETEPDLGEINPARYHPCCDVIEDAPCVYAVIFGCDHSWPAITGRDDFPDIYRYVGLPCDFTDPDPNAEPKFFYQVHRLKKECGPSCRWSETHALTMIAYNEVCSLMIEAKMFPCGLLDNDYFPNEQHTFPQYEYPPLVAKKACYGEFVEFSPGLEADCYAIAVDNETGFRFWSLNLDGTPTLSWEFEGYPGTGNPLAAIGRAKPVYTAPDAWNATGRNNMELTNWEEWPSVPRFICVVAVGGAGVEPACDTEEAQCDCCDNGADTVQFGIVMEGCVRVSGCQIVTSTRECDPGAFEAAYPGATYPGSAPCCVWPFTVGDGDGCSVDGVSWGGSILTVIYCTGSGYSGEAYCFDEDIDEWVLQGSLNVSDFRCLDGCETFMCGDEEVTLCCTWVIHFTLPELDCCCPEDPPAECCPCEDLPATASMTDGLGNTLVLNKSSCAIHPNGEFVAVTGDFCGLTLVNATVQCDAGAYSVTGTFGTSPLTATGDCDGMILTGTWGGCSVTVAI